MKEQTFDIHSHIQFSEYDEDRREVVDRMTQGGISTIVVGTDFASSRRAASLSKNETHVFACVGLHPADNKSETFHKDEYQHLIRENEKIVAVGECGLDYYRGGDSEDDKCRQKRNFEQQIIFAVDQRLPLMLHVRDAHDDVLEILHVYKNKYGELLRGNVHFFSGDKKIAKKYLAMNFSLSFTGVVTFTHDYDEVVSSVPKDMIMAETDCPFVSPVPYRGTRNEPIYVEEVIRRLADIRGEDIAEFSKQCSKNVQRIFLTKIQS